MKLLLTCSVKISFEVSLYDDIVFFTHSKCCKEQQNWHKHFVLLLLWIFNTFHKLRERVTSDHLLLRKATDNWPADTRATLLSTVTRQWTLTPAWSQLVLSWPSCTVIPTLGSIISPRIIVCCQVLRTFSGCITMMRIFQWFSQSHHWRCLHICGIDTDTRHQSTTII